MIYDSHQYGDPMLILERKQEYEHKRIKGCLGCEHFQTIQFKGEKRHSCNIKRWIIQNCQQYQKPSK